MGMKRKAEPYISIGTPYQGPMPTYGEAQEGPVNIQSPDQLSSFVRDTVFPLIGGSPNVRVGNASGMPLLSELGDLLVGRPPGTSSNASGTTNALTRKVILSPNQTIEDANETATHEAGHVADLRGRLPWLDDIASQHYKDVPEDEYGSSNPREYKAVLFQRAVGMIQLAVAQRDPSLGLNSIDRYIRMEEKHTPGIGRAIYLLLQEPMFKDSDLTRLIRERTNIKIGLRRR